MNWKDKTYEGKLMVSEIIIGSLVITIYCYYKKNSKIWSVNCLGLLDDKKIEASTLEYAKEISLNIVKFEIQKSLNLLNSIEPNYKGENI